MTQEQIERITELQVSKTNYSQKIVRINVELDPLLKNCDHKRPNGQSAAVNLGFDVTRCSYCGVKL